MVNSKLSLAASGFVDKQATFVSLTLFLLPLLVENYTLDPIEDAIEAIKNGDVIIVDDYCMGGRIILGGVRFYANN